MPYCYQLTYIISKMQSSERQPSMKQRKLYDEILKNDTHSSSEEEEEENRNHPLLELEIQLENGSKVYINPQPSDEPLRLATEFCEQHNLDTEMIDILAQSIKKSINRSHESYKKQPLLPQQICQIQHKKLNYVSQSCKTNTRSKSPQYFSKKYSVNSSLGLYEKGVMLQDAKKHWIQRQHEHKRIQQMRECTHKPKINKLSRSLITQRSVSRSNNCNRMSEDVSVDKLQKINKHSSKDLYSMRTSILMDSKHAEYTPLNERKMDSNISSSSSSVFLKLYENRKPDEISRSKILLQVLKQETHHPIINGISKEIVGKAKFNQRLVKYQKQKMAKYYKLKKSQLIEKENMYKPKTGPAPQNRNVQGLPIGDFLYNKKKKAPIVKRVAQKPLINQTSKVIYDKKKMTAFERIFEYLDYRKTGRVDWKSLEFDSIQPDLLSIVRPLLEEIEIMQIQLNRQDFKAALSFLFGTLSPTDKGKLLNFAQSPKKSPPDPSKHTVEMNKRSEEIARNIGRSNINIYDYCEIRQTIKLQKIESERIENQKREMKECSFQPKIQKKPIYY